MRWVLWLLVVPLVLGVPQDATLVTVDCNGEADVYYRASGDSLTFFYTENPSLSVAKTFYIYFKLLNSADDLSFVSEGTVTSLRSLSDALQEYQLQLLQAEALAKRYNIPLDVSELNEDAEVLKKFLKEYAEDVYALRREITSFLEHPTCNASFDLTPLRDFFHVYDLARQLLEKSQRIKTELASEENVDLTLVNAISDLITPPFSRSDLDELLSRARSDLSLLEVVLNPSDKDLGRLLEMSEAYRSYEELRDVLNERIVTEVGVFDGIEQAITFLQLKKRELKKESEVDEAVNLFNELKELLDEKKYREALFVAKKLKSKVYSILKAGYKEGEKEEPPVLLYALGVLFVLGILYFLRRRKHEDVDDDSFDLDLPDDSLE